MVVLAGLAAVMSVSPVTARTPAPDFGSTVQCNYRTKSPGPAFTARRFRKFVVTPPQMFALSGQQKVGWRFAVRRTIDEEDFPFPEVTYQSPIQIANATTINAAAFQTMSVGVAVPHERRVS